MQRCTTCRRMCVCVCLLREGLLFRRTTTTTTTTTTPSVSPFVLGWERRRVCLPTCSSAVPYPLSNSDPGLANACKSLRVKGRSAARMAAMGHLGSSSTKLAKYLGVFVSSSLDRAMDGQALLRHDRPAQIHTRTHTPPPLPSLPPPRIPPGDTLTPRAHTAASCQSPPAPASRGLYSVKNRCPSRGPGTR